MDVYPTILDIAKVTPPDPHHGRSLLDPARAPGEPIFFELKTEWTFRHRVTGEKKITSDLWLAVRDGDYKLVLERNESRQELYNLAEDPGEQEPLTERGDRMAALDRALGEHLESIRRDASRWKTSGPARLSEEQRERLRSLGYLDDDAAEAE